MAPRGEPRDLEVPAAGMAISVLGIGHTTDLVQAVHHGQYVLAQVVVSAAGQSGDVAGDGVPNMARVVSALDAASRGPPTSGVAGSKGARRVRAVTAPSNARLCSSPRLASRSSSSFGWLTRAPAVAAAIWPR